MLAFHVGLVFRTVKIVVQLNMSTDRPFCVALEGCCHGDLDKIYGTLKYIQEKRGIVTDLLISSGDFQAIRNLKELDDLACPPKYRELKDFHKYHSGECEAPVPTLFVGGNHEAPAHLRELYYGGYAAKNIYYLGHSGVVNVKKRSNSKPLRVAGISGIYKPQDYLKGHFETSPYDESTKRSAYHVRKFEVDKLLQLECSEELPVDILVSHDWPSQIVDYGDKDWLLNTWDK